MSAETLISSAQGYASNLVSQASSAMAAANSAVSGVGFSWTDYNPAALPSSPPAAINTDLPTLETVDFTAPAEPGAAPAFQDISAIDTSGEPVLSADLPVLELPTKPSQVAEFHGVQPLISTDFVFPEPPDELIHPNIQAPILIDHDTPVSPDVLLPVFTGVMPTDTTVAPDGLDATFQANYATAAPSFIAAMDGYVDAMLHKHNPQYAAQMAALEAQLTRYLAGGTGLATAVEDAIYSRARSKNNAEALRASNAAYEDAAARGFSMPTGAMLAGIQLSRQSAADNNAQAAREIVVMQAEMEQKNLQFAVTTSSALRTSMLQAALSYHQNLVQINGQALDYAKSIMNALIENYNLSVKMFSLKLDAYKADSQVYEVKLRGAMASIELYKAEIQALEALTQVDKVKVDIYRARIETLSSLANVYRSQIEAVVSRMGLEKLKLEVFQSEVQAYTSLVQAKNAEWQGYSYAVQGQESKVHIYSAQVQAYNAQIGGYKAKIDAKSEAARATAMTNQARASQYQATVAGYQTIVQARGEVARTKIEGQRQLILAFQAKIQAEIGNAQVQQSYYTSTSNVAIANAEGSLKAGIAASEARRSFGQTIAQLGAANAHIYAGLASSAMAGMNSLAADTKTTSA